MSCCDLCSPVVRERGGFLPHGRVGAKGVRRGWGVCQAQQRARSAEVDVSCCGTAGLAGVPGSSGASPSCSAGAPSAPQDAGVFPRSRSSRPRAAAVPKPQHWPGSTPLPSQEPGPRGISTNFSRKQIRSVVLGGSACGRCVPAEEAGLSHLQLRVVSPLLHYLRASDGL